MSDNSIPFPAPSKGSQETGVNAPPKKPKDFPLSVHKGTGYWCKKVRGRVYYFGRVADDPDGAAALEEWESQKDDLQSRP